MMPISGVSTGAAHPLTAAEKTLEMPRVQRAEAALKPVMDEYVRSEPQEASGRYWMGKDEDGQSKICFDDPERAAEAPKQPERVPDAKKPDPAGRGAGGPDEKRGGKDELCAGNTEKVDREIEKLKKKQEELEQRLNTETDEAKIKELARQLAQVMQELRRKDSDTYRKQHTTFTQLS